MKFEALFSLTFELCLRPNFNTIRLLIEHNELWQHVEAVGLTYSKNASKAPFLSVLKNSAVVARAGTISGCSRNSYARIATDDSVKSINARSKKEHKNFEERDKIMNDFAKRCSKITDIYYGFSKQHLLPPQLLHGHKKSFNVKMYRLPGGVAGLSLVFCTQGCQFDPGPSRCILMMQKIDIGRVV
ncbi:hypothetical protein TNCV_4404681 [Trichonephila clavipes]|uniref:Uncharacterized protein n=1 Tax=Trichonephila clavipes TaxID=2585209 RepID=A0A8X6S3J7_TRICX|nr:hypothetical protein TNCV_4404681 [Trichonephila clavipes]